MQNKYKKKVLFVGMPDMAIICLARLIAEGFNIIGVVPPHHSDPTYDFMVEFSKGEGLNVINYEKTINDPDFVNKIRILKPDIAIVCSYNKKIKLPLLNSVKDGFINVHPSLLPLYRGANPYSHAIINDEKETGVTMHFMDEDFDTGNIIRQRKLAIEPDDTMGTLFNRLNFLSADMISDFLKQYEINPVINSVPQPFGEYKTAYAIDSENMKNYIDWTKDAAYIERFIRALNPFIIAMSMFRGVFVKVFAADYCKTKVNDAPGTIVSAKETLGVATGDGILCIKAMQYGSYMISDAKSFIEKFKPQIGEMLQ